MDDRQAGKLTSLVPTVQTPAESQVDIIRRVEKPLQVRGKNRNHNEAGPISACGEGLLTRIGTKHSGGALGSAPKKCVAMPLDAQVRFLDSSLCGRQLACVSACSTFLCAPTHAYFEQ